MGAPAPQTPQAKPERKPGAIRELHFCSLVQAAGLNEPLRGAYSRASGRSGRSGRSGSEYNEEYGWDITETVRGVELRRANFTGVIEVGEWNIASKVRDVSSGD